MSLVANNVPLREEATSSPDFKIASCREEWEGAFRLIHHAYVRSGLACACPDHMRITPWQLLPTSDIFVSTLREEVICTISLIGDGELGLPMEDTFSEEVVQMRRQGIRLAEVSCLADRREKLERSLPVLNRIMSLMAQTAEHRGVEELVIAVHPRHAPFYERVMSFSCIGECKSYQNVCNNPAVALTLNIRRLPSEHPRVYRRFFGQRFAVEELEPQPIPAELIRFYRSLMEPNAVSEKPDQSLAAPCHKQVCA